MGYETYFHVNLRLNKKLSEGDYQFLKKLSDTRRMKRDLPEEEYGIDGEFYVEDDERNVIDYNEPPITQPGLWCDWVPTDDRTGIEWNRSESFYNYVEWLEYIIDSILKPRGYILEGRVIWHGEYREDNGVIIVADNEVTAKRIWLVDDDGIAYQSEEERQSTLESIHNAGGGFQAELEID